MIFKESHRDMKPGSVCNRKIFRFINRVEGIPECDDEQRDIEEARKLVPPNSSFDLEQAEMA